MVGRTVEELALLPNEEIAARLVDLRGAGGGEGGNDAAGVFPDIEAGVKKMQAARAEDPAGFYRPLAERALGPLKRALGFEDDDADPARLAVGLRLQAKAGIAQPRALAKAEVGEIAAGLAKLKPSEQAEQIATLEARFGDAFPVARAELGQTAAP